MASLSKKQRQAIDNLLKDKQRGAVKSVRDASCGYQEVVVSWVVPLPIATTGGCTDLGNGWVNYEIFLDITPSGKFRQVIPKPVEVIYPHCCLDWRYPVREAQLSFALPQMLTVPAPPPEKINWGMFKTRRDRLKFQTAKPPKPPKPIQHELPLLGLAAQLFAIRQRQGVSIESTQQLLSAKVEHYSLQYRKVVMLPEVFKDLLGKIEATPAEWEAVEDFMGVLGEAGTLKYIQSIPELRKHFKIQNQLNQEIQTSEKAPGETQKQVVVYQE